MNARRRKNSPLDDIFDLFLSLPWWIGLPAAPALFFTGQHLASDKPPEIKIFYDILFPAMALAALIGGIGSFFRSRTRKKLLNRQRDIDSVRDLSWQEFEYLVGEVYRRQGYFVEENGGGGADGGVDLILNGKKGKVLVQCKRWRTQKVGVDKVRELYGVVMAEKAASGILVTSGHFTNDALAFARRKPLGLVDGPELSRLIKTVQSSFTAIEEPKEQPEPTQKTTESPVCPQCGAEMVLRTARRGKNAGNQFYGCSNYPKCRSTHSL